MQRHRFSCLGVLLVASVASASACARSDLPAEPGDGAFAALQARGEQAMGVDQYTSTHLFDALPDGGRIELQSDRDDPAVADQIRRHLATIAEAFASGDFGTPAFVHMREVPGTAALAALKDRIEYVYRDLPRGAELRLVTDDPEAIRAIHEFMAFQREDHRAGGADHRGHGDMDHGSTGHGAMDHGEAHRMMHHGTRGEHTPGGDTP